MNQPVALKAIRPKRDRAQSTALMWFCAAMLLLPALASLLRRGLYGLALSRAERNLLLSACAISIFFALLVWRLRAATRPAALLGGLICFNLILRTAPDAGTAPDNRILHSALPSLAALFLLTYMATRFRRAQKQAMGLAEPRTGRRASQVAANLGIAAMIGMAGTAGLAATAGKLWLVACLAALAEATADTVSSELGQALKSCTLLLTTLRPVPPGTDGGISIAGTLAGLGGAASVALVGCFTMNLGGLQSLIAFAAAALGLFADSLLGATLERKGWIGNDLVNFASTAVAAACALAFLLLAR